MGPLRLTTIFVIIGLAIAGTAATPARDIDLCLLKQSGTYWPTYPVRPMPVDLDACGRMEGEFYI
jgi:hypothetical protein